MWRTLPEQDGAWRIFRILGNEKKYLLGSYVSREAAQKMCDSLNRSEQKKAAGNKKRH